MTTYACSNCAETELDREYSVEYFMAECKNESCEFEKFVNINRIETLLERARSIGADFPNKLIEQYTD